MVINTTSWLLEIQRGLIAKIWQNGQCPHIINILIIWALVNIINQHQLATILEITNNGVLVMYCSDY
jgi:hypothetical protein